jgi:hypothetical protein
LTVHLIPGAGHETIIREPYVGHVAQHLKSDLAGPVRPPRDSG